MTVDLRGRRALLTTVAFFASDEAAWITGQVFGVDYGLNIPVTSSTAPNAERLDGADTAHAIGLPDLTALGGAGAAS